MNISLKIFLCQCAHISWNMIVSIWQKYMADPVTPQDTPQDNFKINVFLKKAFEFLFHFVC